MFHRDQHAPLEHRKPKRVEIKTKTAFKRRHGRAPSFLGEGGGIFCLHWYFDC